MPSSASPSRCLACGTTRNMNGRRYCSVTCRQRLRRALNSRTGLLKALNVRYATFAFTPRDVQLDIRRFGDPAVLRFSSRRRSGSNPAQDYLQLVDELSRQWWTVQRRTNRTYLADRHVLTCAARLGGTVAGLAPREVRTPAVQAALLARLGLSRHDLHTDQPSRQIKAAFRVQAKRCHPDVGGNPRSFRQVVDAYEELLQWAATPTFSHRRGFPDRWFYHGRRNRWVQPTPL